jgi:hypothetical protein
VLLTAVFLVAVFLGWMRFISTGYNLTPAQVLIGPVYLAELISLTVFRWMRPNDPANIRSFLILVLLLSGVVMIGVLMGW